MRGEYTYVCKSPERLLLLPPLCTCMKERKREREEREGDTHRCTEGRRNESRERENKKVREAGQLYVYVCRAVALDFDAIL